METNYDHWKPVPHEDDRRDPAMQEMRKIGRKNVNLQTMLTVLSQAPVLNNGTVYTALMSAAHPEMYRVIMR